MTVLSVILSLMMAALSVQQPSLFDSFRQKVSDGCVFVDYEYFADFKITLYTCRLDFKIDITWIKIQGQQSKIFKRKSNKN